MIALTRNIWIGDSSDEQRGDIQHIDVVFNVAHDLQGTRGCNCGIEYVQVGLIDGPGNQLASYCAAVLALVSLVRDNKQVLVCAHTTGRPLAVVLMYMKFTSGREWGEVLELFRERVGEGLREPHAAHKSAYEAVDWRLLASAMEER